MNEQPPPQQSTMQINTPSLPKGGGAIQSIGKGSAGVGIKGTASLELSLPISTGRGFVPPLGLGYSSGTGNSSCGIGWQLTVDAVTLRTVNGVPTYDGTDQVVGPDGDVWLPERNESTGELIFRTTEQYNGLPLTTAYDVVRHWPRVEGAFALIEHWSNETDKAGFWLIHGADGSLHIYGTTANSRRADPADPQRVGVWMIDESLNTRGEHIIYEYKAETELPVAPQYRDYRAQRYLKRVCYGNEKASAHLYAWDSGSREKQLWHFQLVFDYGERSSDLEQVPTFEEQQPWAERSDPYWIYAYGFELGNRRLCRQVLMFHHFPKELGDHPVLVQRLLLQYRLSPLGYSHLSAAHQQAYDGLGQIESRPPMEFSYNTFDLAPQPQGWKEFTAMPGLDDGHQYQLVDLYGEGLAGVLCRYDHGWYYREPLRAETGSDQIEYSEWKLLEGVPMSDAGKPVHQSLTDLTGDGKLDWVLAAPGMCGFFTLDPDRNWSGFVPFDAFPGEFSHPMAQIADLLGDGLSDLTLVGPRSVRLYANRRAAGFAEAVDVPHAEKTAAGDDDELPVLSNTPSEIVAFADLIGSGQQHLVRIRHNEVKCWPNLGHGRFGKGFVLCTLPFAYDEFNASRVLLADLDGSGAADLIYMEAERLRIFMNHAGSGFAQTSIDLPWPEGLAHDALWQVTSADLQGLGCSSLVVTLPHMSPRHWRYDFVDAKPYLLNRSCNNMGCSASVNYRSSAQEWLDEKREQQAAGVENPVSGLPMAMHLVHEQIQHDEITGNTLTQLLSYRGGYYDRFEREFRGFRLLLQSDTEASATEFTAPILSKTWFHTGETIDPSRTGYYSRDDDAVDLKPTLLQLYHFNDRIAQPFTEADEETAREIARTLSGRVMRSEVFAAGDDAATAVPYVVQEHRYGARVLRPKGKYQPYAVILPLDAESISYQYEPAIADDPMCQHQLNLEWDPYGRVVHAFTVNYARRKTSSDAPPFTEEHQQNWWKDAHDDAQQKWYLTQLRSESIHLPNDEAWRLGLPCRLRSNSLVLEKAALSAATIHHEHILLMAREDGEWAQQAVLSALTLQRYIDPRSGATLDPGAATFEGLPAYMETAELDAVALSAYDKLEVDGQLPFNLKEKLESQEVGYHIMPLFLPEQDHGPIDDPDDAKNYLWSVHRGFSTYHALDGFHNVQKYRETRSHGETLITYDAYWCVTTAVTLPDGCTTRSLDVDYRTFLPAAIEDANRNLQEARYNAFGEPLVSSFHGTELGEPVGFDPLQTYVPPADRDPAIAIADPKQAIGNFARAAFWDTFSWMGCISRTSSRSQEWWDWAKSQGYILPEGHICDRARQYLAAVENPDLNETELQQQIDNAQREPVYAVSLVADRYPLDPDLQVRVSIACLDGFGRTLQTKHEVPPGVAWQVDDNGELVLDDNGKPIDAQAQRRWRVSEPVEYNNKGQTVRIYRPYFADQPRYINDRSMRKHAFHDQQFYDAVGRPTATVLAKQMLQGNPPTLKPLRREVWYWIWCNVAFDENDLFDPPPEQRRRNWWTGR